MCMSTATAEAALTSHPSAIVSTPPSVRLLPCCCCDMPPCLSAVTIALLQVLSSCDTAAPEVKLEGLRVGYPRDWWKPVADEVRLKCRGGLHSMSCLPDMT